MRAFMAVEVNTKLVDAIIEVQKILAEANAQIKFVEPENLHFTFKYPRRYNTTKGRNNN